jgi:hypothetical protein
VQFTIAAHRQTLALREPISQPAHLLDLSDRTNDIAATLPHPPRSESLHLEISGIRDMSVNASYQRERNVVPIALAAPAGADKQPQRPPRRTPPAREPAAEPDADEAPERITILFDTLADGQQPQLWIEPRHDGGGDVSIRVAARIVRGKIVDDMTAKSLDLYLLPRQQALASVERDWKNMHDLTVFLDRRIGETRAGINPRESIRSLEVKLRAAQREYQKLDDHLQKLKAELAWAEAAQLLIQTIDKHSRLKYRVFAKSGDLEIDLVHGGLD